MSASSLLHRLRAMARLVSLLVLRDGGAALHHCDLIRSASRSGLPTVELADLLIQVRGAPPGADERVVMNPIPHGSGSGSVAEMAAIASLVVACRPRAMLEFGTCDGYSTWHLLNNAGPSATVTTLDLPANTKVEGSTDPALQGITRRPYLPADPRVRLVEIDSRQWTPDVKGGIDLCFVDAGHSYECVRNDTEKAMSLMGKGGLLLWHDATWEHWGYGVNRYLRELLAKGFAVRLVRMGSFDYSGLAACIL